MVETGVELAFVKFTDPAVVGHYPCLIRASAKLIEAYH